MSAGPLALIFTGHMVDSPDRDAPRFPSSVVEPARAELDRRIARHTAGTAPELVQGFASLACGGDIMFHEICRERGFVTSIVLPFAPQDFVETSVAGIADDDNWVERFWALWYGTTPERHYDLGYAKDDNDAYAACNDRILDLAKGAGVPRLIAILDRDSDKKSGGTADFIDRFEKMSGGTADVIDPKTLGR